MPMPTPFPHAYVQVLTEGHMWGVDSVLLEPLDGDQSYGFESARCMTFVEVYAIGRQEFLKAADDRFPIAKR